MNYDIDLGPHFISDWYHQDAFSLYHLEESSGPPAPDSNIMDGKGVYYCNMSDPNCTGQHSRKEINL